MLRSRVLVTWLLLVIAGCSDSTVGPDVSGSYAITVALWLFDGPPSIVAQVERQDAAAPAASSAVIRANGTQLPPGVEPATDDVAVFQLDLPTHAAGDSYSVTAEVGGVQAFCTLASVDPPCTASLVQPAAGVPFVPGEPLSVQWSKSASLPDEFEVNVHRCLQAPGDLAVSETVSPPVTTFEIPSAATIDVARCDSVLVEMIARDVLPVTGDLAGSGSTGYVIHANVWRKVARSTACGFTGITFTDASGIVLSTDPDDWCTPAISDLNALPPAYPNPSLGPVTIRFTLGSSASVLIRIVDGNCNVVRELVNGVRAAGQHQVVWDRKDDAGVDLPAGLYRCLMAAQGFACHGDIELQ